MRDEERLIQILRRPAYLRLQLDSLLERRELCRRRCTAATAHYGGVAASMGGFSRDDGNLVSLADMDRRLEAWGERLRKASRTAEDLLRRVEDLPCRTAPRDAAFLRLRFLRGLTGAALHAGMDDAGFPAARQSIYYWQKSAYRSGIRVLSELPQIEDSVWLDSKNL